MLRRVGFFHFDIADQSDPVRSLAHELERAAKADDLNDCLIVAPEAFNIRNGYWSPDRVRDPKIAETLFGVSNDFKVTLLAGLVDEGKTRDGAMIGKRGICGHRDEKRVAKVAPVQVLPS